MITSSSTDLPTDSVVGNVSNSGSTIPVIAVPKLVPFWMQYLNGWSRSVQKR